MDWQLSAASHKRRLAVGDGLGNDSSCPDRGLLGSSAEPGRTPYSPRLSPPFSYRARLSLSHQECFLCSATFLTFPRVSPSPGEASTPLHSYAIVYRKRLGEFAGALLLLEGYSPSVLLRLSVILYHAE